MIPYAYFDSLTKDTLRAVLGGATAAVVRSVLAIHSKFVGRDRSKMTWRNADEVEGALAELGFSVRRVPLLRDDMEMRCFNYVGEEAAVRLRKAWENKSSIVATVSTN